MDHEQNWQNCMKGIPWQGPWELNKGSYAMDTKSCFQLLVYRSRLSRALNNFSFKTHRAKGKVGGHTRENWVTAENQDEVTSVLLLGLGSKCIRWNDLPCCATTQPKCLASGHQLMKLKMPSEIMSPSCLVLWSNYDVEKLGRGDTNQPWSGKKNDWSTIKNQAKTFNSFLRMKERDQKSLFDTWAFG